MLLCSFGPNFFFFSFFLFLPQKFTITLVHEIQSSWYFFLFNSADFYHHLTGAACHWISQSPRTAWPLGHLWTAGSHHSVYLLPLDLWPPRPPKNPHALSLSWLCVSLATLNPVIWLSSYAPPDTGTVLASTLWVFPASPHTHKIYLHALCQGTEHDWNQMHVALPCSPIFQNLLCTTWLLL